MEKNKTQFYNISDLLFNLLEDGEEITVSCSGESTQFIRFNNAKIRQTGLVDDGDLSINLIHNNRNCEKALLYLMMKTVIWIKQN